MGAGTWGLMVVLFRMLQFLRSADVKPVLEDYRMPRHRDPSPSAVHSGNELRHMKCKLGKLRKTMLLLKRRVKLNKNVSTV